MTEIINAFESFMMPKFSIDQFESTGKKKLEEKIAPYFYIKNK